MRSRVLLEAQYVSWHPSDLYLDCCLCFLFIKDKIAIEQWLFYPESAIVHASTWFQSLSAA